MKRLYYAFPGFLMLLLLSCGNPQSQGITSVSDTAAKGYTGSLISDTLQYTGTGDHAIYTFINRKLDTLHIRWEHPYPGLTRKMVFHCTWSQAPPVPGNDTVLYEMKNAAVLTLPPFVNPDIQATDRRLSYLFFANGGTIGYFNDGTVVGCPRCDPSAGNVESMLNDAPMGTYRVCKDGSLLVNGTEIERPEIREEWNEWMIFDTKEKWEAFMNDIDDLSSARNQQYLLQFVNGYLQQLNRHQGLEADKRWVLSNTDLTDSFKYQYRQLLAGTPQLDADPVLDAQDYPDGQLTVHSFSEEDRYFWLTAKGEKDPVLVARLKLEQGKWLVDGCGLVNIPAGKRLHKD